MSEPKPSIDELILCAERELKYRRRVYPRLVDRGTMGPRTAQHEIKCMEAILENLTNQRSPKFNL